MRYSEYYVQSRAKYTSPIPSKCHFGHAWRGSINTFGESEKRTGGCVVSLCIVCNVAAFPHKMAVTETRSGMAGLSPQHSSLTPRKDSNTTSQDAAQADSCITGFLDQIRLSGFGSGDVDWQLISRWKQKTRTK